MLTVLSCIVVDHNPAFTIAAVMVCLTGSLLTMRLFARARHTRSATRFSWLALAGIIGGATIWTTHFVAMMGYKAGVVVGYEPVGTLSSLALAILVTSAGFLISTVQQRGALIEAGGAVVGLGIAAMHYMGMDAYEVHGIKEWNENFVLASLVAGALLGAIATNRIGRPVTRFCKYGGVAGMILAIASTHFIGMAGLRVVPSAEAVMPPNVVPEGVLIVVVVAIMLMILALGAASYLIDLQSTNATAERYRHLSMHDALTGLPNRVALLEHLGEVIERPVGRSPKVAVLSIDLDRFKAINDVHGHAAGDHVLRVLSQRISAVLNEDEFLGRFGGDEFVAVKSHFFTRSDAVHFANRLIAQIVRPIDWKQQVFSVGSSVGISIYPDAAHTVDDLLAQADVAMYRAKSTGSNKVFFYDISMDKSARERNALAMDMRTALQQGQFELYYQRQNETSSGKVIGFEVLLRWNHPQRGRISPNDFIPIAEKTGLINEIGDWVLEQACREAASWNNPLSVAVNVAPSQLADVKFPHRVQEILLAAGLAPERLELEITESGIIQDQQRALQTIRQLKKTGVRVAMDDYGTGYSSLSTLQLFPFDKIKIDRSFIDGVATNPHSAAIVRSTLILAASLDIPVLAEGVEKAEHMAFLLDEGCQQVQGFFYGRPSPRADIEADVNGFETVLPAVAQKNVAKKRARRAAA